MTNITWRSVLAEVISLAFIMLVLAFIVASPADAQEQATVASVALSERIPTTGHTTPFSTHLVSTQQVAADDVGGNCDVNVVGMNNESVHPHSNIIIESANVVKILDVERESNATSLPADGTLALGDTVTVSVQLGEDGLFSGGTLVVDFSCTSPPPPTTTTQPTTTTTSAVTTTTKPAAVPPPECDDSPATSTPDCLPRTGSTALPLVTVGAAAVGGGLLLVRRSRKARA